MRHHQHVKKRLDLGTYEESPLSDIEKMRESTSNPGRCMMGILAKGGVVSTSLTSILSISKNYFQSPHSPFARS